MTETGTKRSSVVSYKAPISFYVIASFALTQIGSYTPGNSCTSTVTWKYYFDGEEYPLSDFTSTS